MKNLFFAFVLLVASVTSSAAVKLEPAFPNLKFTGKPLFLTSAAEKLFVLEQDGKVWTFPNDPRVTPAQVKLFADFSQVISRDGPELGLLGMAFAPDFADSHLVFFSFTDANWSLVVVKALVSSTDPDRVEPRTVEEIIRVEKVQHQENHNGGMIAFSPLDGFLYISTGDGGGAGDPLGNSQNKGLLLGKILRIDPFHPVSPRQKYAIPADNPFRGDPQARPEIYALGLRNTWRFSFDRTSGTLFAGDVGQNRFEEVNIIKRGGNYGWNVYEAFQSFKNPSAIPPTVFQSPIIAYGRDQGVSVTGGYVYRGQRIPSLSGWYVYGDFGTGKIWALNYDGTKVVQNLEIARSPMLVSFAEDQSGELYLLSWDGEIKKLVQ